MNANELADYLEGSDLYSHGDVKDAVDTLRQQQSEIEVLKETLKKRDYLIDLILEQGIKDDT